MFSTFHWLVIYLVILLLFMRRFPDVLNSFRQMEYLRWHHPDCWRRLIGQVALIEQERNRQYRAFRRRLVSWKGLATLALLGLLVIALLRLV